MKAETRVSKAIEICATWRDVEALDYGDIPSLKSDMKKVIRLLFPVAYKNMKVKR